VQGFLSSRSNWLYPPPHPQASVALPLRFRGGGGGGVHLLEGRRGGGSNSDEGTDTLLLLVPNLYDFEPLKLMIVDFNKDLDPAIPSYDPDPASKINLGPCGSGFVTLVKPRYKFYEKVTLSRQEDFEL
jgi:hypothetical protein